ncbi:MAG: hypothetical protein DI569_12195 [Sphingopyxis macrogoltabida]|uniref:Uncharacterized protein n=1 Tax=Sphingopyxis macrogoltabida TaxID=33050 RepID=A0A2W5KWH5_SPHMC|nr:MAG: hypothetical protein DI569_12195 [Sphingopyxis macrogoltabida]
MTRILLAATAAVALFGAGQAAAWQTTNENPAATAEAKKKQADGTTPEERSNTARLNAEQAARAKQENVTYQQEVSAAEQQVAADQATFVEETAAYEEEKARLATLSAEERIKYEADVAAWKADVEACKAGHRSRCAKEKPALPPQPQP